MHDKVELKFESGIKLPEQLVLIENDANGFPSKVITDIKAIQELITRLNRLETGLRDIVNHRKYLNSTPANWMWFEELIEMAEKALEEKQSI